MTKLHRFHIQPKNIHQNTFWTDNSKISEKIRKVLRLNKGDQILIFDGKGNEYIAELTLVAKNETKGTILEEKNRKLKEKPKIIIAQALTRSSRIDQVIRMNTEVGVYGFILFESEYSVVKTKDLKENKIERWKRVATDAARQSERVYIPKIAKPISFKQIITSTYKNKILLHSRKQKNCENIIETIKELDLSEEIVVIIGPEGGFSKDEINTSEKNRVQIVYLDLPILRTETAGVVVSSYILLNNTK
ncbi:RsmE family RNA methyltransferase [Candidatus Dojkabacteria bacterium]|nr:RsmE family RNA methyltransferase [Candidatus Dojkabacteria bacterium]